jgi:hypothetical protein
MTENLEKIIMKTSNRNNSVLQHFLVLFQRLIQDDKTSEMEDFYDLERLKVQLNVYFSI